MKSLMFISILLIGISVRAEWYEVTEVVGYNQIKAHRCKGAESKETIVIRIMNLEKIEYIINDRTKTFLGGTEPNQLLEKIMEGQVVWVEGLENLSGEYVAHVYPSYEQVLNVFMQQRMTGSYAFSPVVKQKLSFVGKRMVALLRRSNPPRTNRTSEDEEASKKINKAYEHEYSKLLFVYDALNWFKESGQYLPVSIQEMYVEWISEYMSENGAKARDLEIKIKDFQERSSLYHDFIFDE